MLRWLVVVAAALLVVGPLALFQRSPAAEAARAPETHRVGALLHSRWLDPRAALPQERTQALVRDAGLQVLALGVPVGDPTARAASPAALEAWLAAMSDVPTVPMLNTFVLPKAQQTHEGLRAFFQPYADLLQRHPNVLAVAGANEPLTKGKAWASPAEAEARVRLEYAAWHDVSPLPLCHKFTNPRIDTPGTEEAMLERLWAEAQDAVCYDWYVSSGDTAATLDHLREVGARLGKPVHVLEAAVPGNDPATLTGLARRVDSFVVYQLLATSGGEDERLAAWVWDDAALREKPAGAMLRVALKAPAARP